MTYIGTDDRLAVVGGDEPGKLKIFHRDVERASKECVGAITGLAARGDGRSLVIANDRQLLQFHDAETGEATSRPFTGEPGEARNTVTRVIYNPDRSTVAAFRVGDTMVREWSDAEGGLVRVHEGEDPVECIAFGSQDHLAIARADGTVVVHSTSSRTEPIRIWQQRVGVKQMAFSHNGKRLALACGDGHIRIFALISSMPRELQGNAVIKQEAGVRARNPEEEITWLELLSIPVSGVSGLAFGPEDKSLAAAGPAGVVVLGSIDD